MKRYKLLKDTPTIKAGTVFISNGTYVTQVDCDTKINIEDILDFNDWFEEVKEFEEWKPKGGEKYKSISDDGGVSSYHREDDDVDRFNFSIGNAYPLGTPDELIIKEQKLIPQAMHRLKMAAKKAWFEFNGSDGPDWDDLRQRQFEIHLDRRTDELYIMKIEYTQSNILPPFPTQKSCQAYIDNNLDDLKLLFGVE